MTGVAVPSNTRGGVPARPSPFCAPYTAVGVKVLLAVVAVPPARLPLPFRLKAPRKPAPATSMVPFSARLPATSIATTPPVPPPVAPLIDQRSAETVPATVADAYCGTQITCQLRTLEVLMACA